MTSYITTFLNYIFGTPSNDDDDLKDEFLAEQLIDLELTQEKNEDYYKSDTTEIPRDAQCFQRTGIITYIDNIFILIDGTFYFDISACSLNLNENDKILYLGYKDANDSIIVVRVIQNYGISWGEEECTDEESKFKVIEHVLVEEVDYRENRFVYLKNNDLKFSLDDVEGTFIPIKGDWLELKCSVQFNEDQPSDISAVQVLQVKSFKPLRTKVRNAAITEWSGEHGSCDRLIYFNRQCSESAVELQVGSKVLVEAIESNQGAFAWRAIKLILVSSNVNDKTMNVSNENNMEKISLSLEEKRNIIITHPLKFENIDLQQTSKLNLNITNNSDQVYIINKWIVLTKRRDSQVNISPSITTPKKLYPQQIFCFTVTCKPKFLGNAKEHLIVFFQGFKIERYIHMNVVNDDILTNHNIVPNKINFKANHEKIESMKKIRRDDNKTLIPGKKLIRPPNFVSLKLGSFTIPEKIWNAVLGDSKQTIYSSDYDKILTRITIQLPCLLQDLNINNYTDRWHTLLFMEEIQENINIRVYDMPKVFLIRCQEYLTIEINELSEKRPSLMKGDRVIVKDIWNSEPLRYEGYIHMIKGNLVMMKFNHQFQDSYSGSDVSIEFHFSRTMYRRSHQAINLALTNLGPNVLFPSRIVARPHQISPETLNSIVWFNKYLNNDQKAAITNILLGECRPLPYCIYGPPGTGKTVTVIETILQILTLLPDSRILVATPSNSAANLITERLIEFKNALSSSIIRLIANHLVDSDNIPDVIKPFCGTLDIALENTAKSKHIVNNGMNLNCQTSFIGRHRVTIGTCYCLGSLALMGLPKGHFTHIIVDEAGQATEPEIMIPLTFTDKENSQIILAGDPMQLGPIILSKYCKEFGFEESYLTRVLETFPYQKDYAAFANGFNNKFVTKLNDNYRSLQEVLELPSEMFYDASLVAKIDRNKPWVDTILTTISELYEIVDTKTGGIYVYGIKGYNTKAEDSPSWYNPHEAAMVALTACKMYKKNIAADEIGIITPYIAQVKYLKLLFNSMGLPPPKIGTVEEFQGQERRIIMISTVRSTESQLVEDQKHHLGFVRNPKRLNVALTRAQVAVLLFCDPYLLCTDPLWCKVIKHAIKTDRYTGCDLPIISENNIV